MNIRRQEMPRTAKKRIKKHLPIEKPLSMQKLKKKLVGLQPILHLWR